jgi:hypothetical protein
MNAVFDFAGKYVPGVQSAYTTVMKEYDTFKGSTVGGFVKDIVTGTLDPYSETNPYGSTTGYQLPEMDTSLMAASTPQSSATKIKSSKVQSSKIGATPRVAQALQQLKRSQNKATRIQVKAVPTNLKGRTTINLR